MKWLDFKITQRCNNHCRYCNVKHDKPTSKDMLSVNVIKKTIYEAINLEFTHFAFLGGEPTLRHDYQELFTPFRDPTAEKVEEIMIISNILQFNENMVENLFCSNTKRATFTASIDNLVKPNFKNQNPQKVLRNLKKIQKIAYRYEHRGNREIHIHSVISRENFSNILNHVEYFDNLGYKVSMAIVEPYILTDSPRKYNEFSKSDFEKIIEQLDQLERTNKLNWANQVLRDYISEYILNSQSRLKNCTAGKKHVIIEFDGNVYPCLTESYRRGLTFGNIQAEDFSQIYEKMQNFLCQSEFHQTCWDHYLWSRLAREK
ncbi:MAG: radical SAM protein [Candidatus Lokiarchaeota archaeon]|nr:radical SAM protein [Candidatus Harpocratesius repetitus]